MYDYLDIELDREELNPRKGEVVYSLNKITAKAGKCSHDIDKGKKLPKKDDVVFIVYEHYDTGNTYTYVKNEMDFIGWYSTIKSARAKVETLKPVDSFFDTHIKYEIYPVIVE